MQEVMFGTIRPDDGLLPFVNLSNVLTKAMLIGLASLQDSDGMESYEATASKRNISRNKI